MENESLNKIKKFARNELRNTYRVCSCTESTLMCILNSSDDDGREIAVIIEIKDR